MKLNGSISLVTGAGSGIGRELAVQLAQHGPVVCVGRRPSAVRETRDRIEKLDGTSIDIAADVTRPVDVARIIETAIRRFGRIDLVFNCAGSFDSVGPLWEVDADLWWRDVTTNLLGTMLMCRAALPHLIAHGGGAIVNMDGGGGAGAPNLGGSGYGASKAAVVRLTEGLARELEHVDSPVLALCVNPGFVRSPMTERLADGSARGGWQTFVQDLFDQGKGRAPAEAAREMLRLVELASSELNGCTLDVTMDSGELEQQKLAIQARQLLTMRLRPLDREATLRLESDGAP